MTRAWLIVAPDPAPFAHAGKPDRRRRITRTIGGRLVTVFRLPVRWVIVLETNAALKRAHVVYPIPTANRPALEIAGLASRLRHESKIIVDTWVPFERLASTREKFVARFLDLARVIPERPAPSLSQQASGVHSNACACAKSIDAAKADGRQGTGGKTRETPAAP